MTYSQLALVFKKHDNVWYVNTFEHGHFKLILSNNSFFLNTCSFCTLYRPTKFCFILCLTPQYESPYMNELDISARRIKYIFAVWGSQRFKFTKWPTDTFTLHTKYPSSLSSKLPFSWCENDYVWMSKIPPPPPFGSRVQYYLRDTLISFCIKELSCQTGQWIQPNVWLWLWKWERADHCAR